MGAHTERRRLDKVDFGNGKNNGKPQRLVLEAIREIKDLETVQLKRWQKPPQKT
jgi:hypothetical protein